MTVIVECKLPLNPGCYFLTFGLTYGFDDSLQVGKEVTLNLESKASLYETLSDGQFSLDRFFEIAMEDTQGGEKSELGGIQNPYENVICQEVKEETPSAGIFDM